MVQFFTKMGKMIDLDFGTSYKDGLCPKLEDKSYKAKIGPQNVFYDTSCPFLRFNISSIEICYFWLKSALKYHFMYPGGIIWLQYVLLKQK